MKIIDTSENSFSKRLFDEFKHHTIKYYYGIDGQLNATILAQQQEECIAIMHKYKGEKSVFVNGMCRAVNQFIAHRYADSLNAIILPFDKASKNYNTDQVYQMLPEFFDALWSFFCKYINGHNGSGIWTEEDWQEMGGNCLETDFKQFTFLDSFWYGFHHMCILAVVDWVEERDRNAWKMQENLNLTA